jgi:hypothetical protein
VPYFHVVFTLPAQIGAIAYQNKAKVYGLLFAAAAEALTTIAADPKHLGAEIGVTAVLHTWGQNLDHHPHVHCIVPGGGIAADGEHWVRCRPNFFLPVRVLSRLFRRLFLQRLAALHAAGDLQFFANLAGLSGPVAFAAYLASLHKTEWVVYAKRPFAGPKQVLAYLARYTHRVAIANSRLLSLSPRQGLLPLEGLSPGRQEQAHDAYGRRVHPALPTPCPPRWVPSHPPLRPVRQWSSREQVSALSSAALWVSPSNRTGRGPQ